MVQAEPLFEDAVGAQLLTSVLTLPAIIKERHDTLEFLNHIYIRHEIRLVVAVDGLLSPSNSRDGSRSIYRSWGRKTLHTGLGRIVVPLGDLDRHSRATTHITDEAGNIVPLFTASELNELLGGGLVAYAAQTKLQNFTPELAQHLREIPLKASANLQSADMEAQVAADIAFDAACQTLLEEFGRDGLELLRALQFRLALAAITSAVQLVVAVDPGTGPTRVLTYSYMRPITPMTDADELTSRGFWTKAMRYLRQSGTTRLRIDLGAMGGCDRYHLSAKAPFDTWFADARMDRADGRQQAFEDVDTSQEFRLTYTQMSAPTPWSGALLVDLRTVYTGVVRASVYGSAFLAACAIAGTLRVWMESKHLLIASNTDAAASLLLLFPGIAASVVAGAARNTLTATLQFPLRVTLWSMSLISFILAVSAAFRLGGTINLVLWASATVVMCTAALLLQVRSRQWKQGASRDGGSSRPSEEDK